jgi:hypothetical protein
MTRNPNGLEVFVGCLFFCFILSIPMGSWVVQSFFEARAFNNATGANVSTWDAMWIELRVQGDGK